MHGHGDWDGLLPAQTDPDSFMAGMGQTDMDMLKTFFPVNIFSLIVLDSLSPFYCLLHFSPHLFSPLSHSILQQNKKNKTDKTWLLLAEKQKAGNGRDWEEEGPGGGGRRTGGGDRTQEGTDLCCLHCMPCTAGWSHARHAWLG